MKRTILTASHIAVATMYLGTTTIWTSSGNPGSIEQARSCRRLLIMVGSDMHGLAIARAMQAAADLLDEQSRQAVGVVLGDVLHIAPAGSVFPLLQSFTGAPGDCANPSGGLIQG